jgi:hypothetical protein
MAAEDNGNEDAYMSKSLIAIRIYFMSSFLREIESPGSKGIASLLRPLTALTIGHQQPDLLLLSYDELGEQYNQ